MSKLASVVAALVLAACATDPAGETPDPTDPGPTCVGKCDGGTEAPSPAELRRNLLANLHAQMDGSQVLFGQERFNITGVNADGTQWLASAGHVDRSDVATIAGDHPVVMGFDAWDLAIKPATWNPTGAVHAEAARHVYESGGIVALEWHMRGCAADSFNAAGNEACMCRLANDDAYARTWLLGNYAVLADAMTRFGLDKIPIVFRPLHEHNGNWFWWGKPYWSCGAGARFTGAAAFTRVYRTIIDYLRRERGLDNLLVAYAPGGDPSLETEQGYLDGYPGDAYVDILGADLYYQAQPGFAAQTTAFKKQLATIAKLAYARNKVAALTEVGDTQLSTETTQSHWFTEQLAPLLAGSHVAYALTWENRTSGPQQFWVPYGAHPGVADFQAFAASAQTALISDAPDFAGPPAHGFAVCASCTSDPDGDRWGWEAGASCRVASWCVAPAFPPCAHCSSDPDGDGWGWENQRSCEVLATCR